ncbi:hypothetical protein ACFSCX_06470 [Bacillus salitolerans]|uniref:Uncharacterized protein n=1 Tax=Bacillus salitolerans TaxID=1437434 RepID=A0ABW4LM82_9BACI
MLKKLDKLVEKAFCVAMIVAVIMCVVEGYQTIERNNAKKMEMESSYAIDQ